MSVQAHSSDVDQLHRMGYAQELLRRMSGFSNFAVSFTIISILSGCLTLFYFGMSNGGPAVITIGWPLVGVMVILVGLAMAEVCSSYPTAGGLYYWAAKLEPAERGDRHRSADQHHRRLRGSPLHPWTPQHIWGATRGAAQ